ncbi:MAG: exopolyphosphatase [Campylobacterales bacterium]|nr:exopolyphosphatase [Campylobacterales bacterium]
MSSIVTAIDLGSNSFRVLKYDFAQDISLGEFECTVGTADGLAQTGIISNEAVDRIIEAIGQSLQKIEFIPSDAIAVTTSAMRQAKNSLEVIERIFEATGVKFHIIDGTKEARYTLQGLQYALKKRQYDNENFILCDIGGGSTELIFVIDQQNYFKSFEIGIVTLTQSNHKEQIIQNYFDEINLFIQTHKFDLSQSTLIATAGTPTTIAALKHGLNYVTYDKNIINGTVVTLEDLIFYKKFLLSISKEEAERLTGTNRSQYIVSGIDIFIQVYNILGKNQSIVFDEGLREGVAVAWHEGNL